MSHRATNWAFSQNGLKPAAKLVLLCLADRHNNDFGCFPAQATLAHDACISRSSLNDQLAELEEIGLIRRERRHNIGHRRRTTRYHLAFEDDFTPAPRDPCPESGHGSDAAPAAADEDDEAEMPCPESGHGPTDSMSEFPRKPCPNSGGFHVQNSDSNLGREPGKGTSRATAREAAPSATVSGAFWTALLAALGLDPDDLPPFWRDWPPREHVRRWRDDLGIPEPRIVELARASRTRRPAPPDGPKALDRLMADEAARIERAETRERGAAPPAAAPAPKRDIIEIYADWVNGERYLPPSLLTNRHRDELIARGLVTPERLRARGVP